MHFASTVREKITMDGEQEEVQFLGFCDIIKESFNVISSWRKFFSQITLALILPLAVTFASHIWISELIFGKIITNENRLLFTRMGSPTYNEIVDNISSEVMAFVIFTVLYYIFLLVFSLLSTSAVVYTIACIYTGKDITFRKVMSVVPKVWKRLMVTFLWSFTIVFAYNFFSFLLLMTWGTYVGDIGEVGSLIYLVTYLSGVVYIGIVWHLASVISVLEDLDGLKAMMKSQILIQGKIMVSGSIYIMFNISFMIIQAAFMVLGSEDIQLTLGGQIGYGIVFLTILVVLILTGIVVQTIIYFVCKSKHHENIDKSSLADHLEEYLGEYMPLRGMDVQLEQVHV